MNKILDHFDMYEILREQQHNREAAQGNISPEQAEQLTQQANNYIKHYRHELEEVQSLFAEVNCIIAFISYD